jgi:hypothetical protein
VLFTQNKLPEALRTVFESTLKPDLLAFLRENLVPLNASLLVNSQQKQKEHHEALFAKISEVSGHYESLSVDIELIKQYISRQFSIRRQHELGPNGDNTSPRGFLPRTDCLSTQESTQTRRTHGKEAHAMSENNDETNGNENLDHLPESLGTM